MFETEEGDACLDTSGGPEQVSQLPFVGHHEGDCPGTVAGTEEVHHRVHLCAVPLRSGGGVGVHEPQVVEILEMQDEPSYGLW